MSGAGKALQARRWWRSTAASAASIDDFVTIDASHLFPVIPGMASTVPTAKSRTPLVGYGTSYTK